MPPTINDPVKGLPSISFSSLMKVLNQTSLSFEDQRLILKEFQDHPEWVNHSDENQQTLLIHAADQGHLEVVKTLIKAGAKINLRDQDGWTALIHAADQGHLDVVKTLIEAGANVNLHNFYGRTALILASRQGNVKIVQALASSGADLNYQTPRGMNALMWASYRGHLEVVQELINQGADPHPSRLDLNQKTALELAQQAGHSTVVTYLEAYAARQRLSQTIQPLETSSSFPRL